MYLSKRDVRDEIDYDFLKMLDEKTIHSSTLTNKNYNFEHYNISLCTDELTNIFINVINKLTYQNYVTIIKNEDLGSKLDISKFVKIVYGCFESKPNYVFNYEVQTNMIVFYFSVCFDGFYEITQSINLMEKEFNQDKQLSAKIIELETRIKELEIKEIVMGYDSSAYGKFIKIKKDVEVIDFREWNDEKFKWYGNWWEFTNLEKLNKIIVSDSQLTYDFSPIVLQLSNSTRLGVTARVTSANSNYCNSGGHYISASFTSPFDMTQIFNNPQIYLPNVKEIIVHYKNVSDFNSFVFNSLPNLIKVTFEQYGDKEIKTFNFIKNNKIKNVIYNNCLNITELELIKNYFQTNNYSLKITK